jgi:hypothetical protein
MREAMQSRCTELVEVYLGPLKNAMLQAQGHIANWTFVPKGTLQSVESASEKVRWGYRFGFNGQHKDDEVYGATGTSTTAEFWQYDTRTGRRWNLDPVPQVSISDYAAFRLNPIRYNDPDGDCPTCPTMAIGALVGFGVGIYDLSQQDGGFWGAMDKLASLDSKAWAHVGTTTVTGIAVGSGVGGLAGAVGISAASSTVDQYVQTGKVDPAQVAVSAVMGGVGWGAGKLVGSTLMAPKTSVGTGLTPIVEKIVIPKNNLPQVLGVETGLALSGAVAEKLTSNAISKPLTPAAPATPGKAIVPKPKASTATPKPAPVTPKVVPPVSF